MVHTASGFLQDDAGGRVLHIFVARLPFVLETRTRFCVRSSWWDLCDESPDGPKNCSLVLNTGRGRRTRPDDVLVPIDADNHVDTLYVRTS